MRKCDLLAQIEFHRGSSLEASRQQPRHSRFRFRSRDGTEELIEGRGNNASSGSEVSSTKRFAATSASFSKPAIRRASASTNPSSSASGSARLT